MERKDKIRNLLVQILSRRIFRRAFEVLRRQNGNIALDQIANILQRGTGLTGSTIKRRAQTVLPWIKWAEERTI